MTEAVATVNVCRSCSAPIRWARFFNAEGAAMQIMPIDAEPSLVGNLVLAHRDGKPCVRAAVGDEQPRYVTHFMTCPNAEKHRRRR